ADAVAQSLAAYEWLRAQGCRQFFFKYCSTFDSTDAGNIGPVADALLDAADPGLSPVLTFDPADDIAAPFIATGARPRVAI
ncbi:four-carbon acid sugar kinase family protein, partial [Vibrio diabolicus]